MAGEDRAYLARVRALPCCACGESPPSEAHHRTGAGMGLKAHDHDSMPLCSLCHYRFHALSLPFKSWGKERLRAWQDEQVAKTRSLLYVDDDTLGFFSR